jgi:hypothetical protein
MEQFLHEEKELRGGILSAKAERDTIVIQYPWSTSMSILVTAPARKSSSLWSIHVDVGG